MMKSIIKSLLLATSFCLCGSVSAAAVVTLNADQTNLAIGDIMTVEVWATKDPSRMNLLGFGLSRPFSYSPSPENTTGDFLSLLGYTLGPGFTDAGSSGYYVYGNATSPIAADSVLLATLTYEALDYAVGSISVYAHPDFPPPSIPVGSYYGLAYSGDNNFTISDTISPVTVNSVPIPSALWLFSSGLLAMIGVMKSRNTATV